MTIQGSILFVDAYDSFAENIAALFRQQLRVEVTLIQIDCDVPAQFGRSLEDFFASFDAIVLGPGPGSPQNHSDVGLFSQVWGYAGKSGIPVLGICLGFQSLCLQYGVPVVRMDMPCHGHAKRVFHTDKDIFAGARDVVATNYNSLGVQVKDLKRGYGSSRPVSSGSMESISSSQSLQSTASYLSKPSQDRSRHGFANDLEILAWDQNDWVMAVKHRLFPFHGLQFHPESCKSNPECRYILEKWWQISIAHNSIVSRPSSRETMQRLPYAPLSTNSNSESSNRCPLLKKLSQLAKSSGNHVTCTTISLAGKADDIASLCHEMSPSGPVVMLESTKRGRYSMYAFPDSSNFHMEYAREQCSIFQVGCRVARFHLDREIVMQTLEAFTCSKQTKDDEHSIPFRGGFMGFLSYEFGTTSLNMDVPLQQGSEPSTPDISLLWVDRSIVFDQATRKAYVQSIRQDDRFWVEEMVQKLMSISQLDGRSATPSEDTRLRDHLSFATFTMPDHDQYISQIRACQSELLAGNSYELCLTTEATVYTPRKLDYSWLIYKNIQRHNPVPYASYLRLNKITILSSSPEQFLSWSREGTIDMIPMKGTVKKSPDMTLDKASTILASAKESAENLMIADLIRHDLYSTVGRDAVVEVVKLCDVVETETVFALVSHVRAHVPPAELHADEQKQDMTKYGIKALGLTLPPGSMTGAPKKRSCEILHHLEQRDRGVYSGAIGYMDVNGNGAWSVCIRTAFSNEDDEVATSDDVDGQPCSMPRSAQKWRIGAGGAITVLSDPEQEWEEMMTKLDSVLRGFRLD
ncbi:aminodeoxychorismate synthase [Capronia epimyces CBS 606.96]|uniref:aminodeoxychorismate synthase n=1 Tax=Capronia epimyces CBS 606.96 TaxID=1182542 RepID=W9YEC1_9EURO|nr:aminodeoxychorismate synthase [Capronia epimyces CBS 606.96]EXJ87621.1 aminodeoxychorismate synthase [Capronia epimyces CBS 606.96]